ncbi:MAG: flagellar hook-associated protein FlgK [bacterium]|jgi:flagellar hook-associated protein 1 FlgK|nr:flagellar hook-associated protein FlgK [bacterium]
MSTLTGLLDTARSALLAHQMALNVTGHNVANVSTEGYTRQRLELGARLGSEQRLRGIGAGVEPIALQRLRLEHFDRSYRRELAGLGSADQRDQLLRGIEAVVGEPGTPGVGDALDSFFSAWADLGNEPAEESYRRAVLEAGSRLAGRLNQLNGQLRAQRTDTNLEVASIGRQINEKTARLADLNRNIQSAEQGGRSASDLRDARDLLVDDLARLVDVRAAEDAQGTYRVWVGGRALVDGVHAVPLSLRQEPGGDGTVLTRLDWSDTGAAIRPRSGELAGLLEVRDTVIPARLAELDALAAELVREVNTLHRGGSDLAGRAGRDFFDPARPGAADIALSRWVLDDPQRVAASADGGIGNGEAAAAIALLAERGLAGLSGRSLGEAWGSLVSQVGAETARAADERSIQQAFVTELDARRQSMSGVNLDEELTRMMAQEQAYAAAARVVSVADNMLLEVLKLV